MLPVIQIFGLPGSGKTYLSNRLKKELEDRQFRVINRSEVVLAGLRHKDIGLVSGFLKKLPIIVWHKIFHEDYCLQELLDVFSKNPTFAEFIFHILEQSDVSQIYKRAILGAFATTCIEYEFAEKLNFKKQNILLADEWFYHRFYTLFGNSFLLPTFEQVSAYLEAVPITSVAIFITTPPSLCALRMKQRQRYPQILTKLSSEEIDNTLTRGYEGLSMLAEEIHRRHWNLYSYDGTSDNIGVIADYCSSVLS